MAASPVVAVAKSVGGLGISRVFAGLLNPTHSLTSLCPLSQGFSLGDFDHRGVVAVTAHDCSRSITPRIYPPGHRLVGGPGRTGQGRGSGRSMAAGAVCSQAAHSTLSANSYPLSAR